MQTKIPVTVAVITLNEASNLPRALGSVSGWVQDLVVVDSGSHDGTQDIALSFGARVFQNPWRGYGQQKNFALKQAHCDWVLCLDADEEVSSELRDELRTLFDSPHGTALAPQPPGYRIPRKTQYLGRWILHGGWYPNAQIRLAHRKHSAWTEPPVHEQWQLFSAESPGLLSAPILHYSFPTIESQIHTNLRFARLGTQALRERGQEASLLKLLCKPLGKFLECYFWKLGFLDGLAGFIIAINAAHSIFLKYAYLFEKEDPSCAA